MTEQERISKWAERAYPVFEREGWSYGLDGEITLEQVRETISYLIGVWKECFKENGEETVVATGRFVVMYDDLPPWRYKVLLELDEVEEWEAASDV